MRKETKAQFAKEKNIKKKISKLRAIENEGADTWLRHATSCRCSSIQCCRVKPYAFVTELVTFQVYKNRIKTESLCYLTAF